MSDKRRAILRIIGPDVTQETVEVSPSGVTIGRLDTNELSLKHSKISRQHTRLELTEGVLTVEDLGSSNGTYIGDRRLEPQKPEKLELGQAFRVGPFTLTYEDLREVDDSPELPSTQALSRDVSPVPPKREEVLDTLPPLDVNQIVPLDNTIVPSIIADSPSTRMDVILPPSPPPPQIPEERLPAPNGKGPRDPALVGIPSDFSSYLNYLPGIFREDLLLCKLLLIPESINTPIEWLIDNFEMYLQPQYAPDEFLHWYASWFGIYMPEKLSIEGKIRLIKEIPNLYMARGTRKSLTRHLELVFGISPVIEEPEDKPATFTVILNLGQSGDTEENRDMAKFVIESQRPAHTNYILTIR